MHRYQKLVLDNMLDIALSLRIISTVSILFLFGYLCNTCGNMVNSAHASTPDSGWQVSVEPLPPPITKEEYMELNLNDRYGACYPYCKEANQHYANEIWQLIDFVNILKQTIIEQRVELQSCQKNRNMPPIRNEFEIQLFQPSP